MNYLEFKRQLMVDPYTKEARFVAARENDADCARAAAESDQFEQCLQRALQVEIPPGLAEQIILHRDLDEQAAPRQTRVWPQSLAAGLFAAALTAGIFSWNIYHHAAPEMETFVLEHWAHDGAAVMQRASNSGQHMAPAEMTRVLASVGIEADPALLERLMYVKNCPSPKGMGAHMVLNTSAGMVTVFFAPGVDELDTERMSIDQVVALLIGLDSGAAAVVGEQDQGLLEASDLIRSGLQPLST